MKPLFLVLGMLALTAAMPSTAQTRPTASTPMDLGCGADADAQAAHQRDAADAIALLNRLANAANAMSMAQAARSGMVVQTAPVPQLGAEMSRAIEHALNCGEQRQAAAATDQAIAAPAGTTVRWTSETRPNVSGSSTAGAREAAAADGSECLTVTDVVIIDGEETRAPKRMCRTPPSNRFVRV